MAERLQQEHDDESIATWVANGLYTPDAILSRWTVLWDEIQPRMASLAGESSNMERLSESAFIAHLQKQDKSFKSEDGIEAARTVFSSIRYLAKLPFISEPSHPGGLTAKELSIAATWLFFTRTVQLSNLTRTRTLADYRRITFQSFAVLDDRPLHDSDDWYQYSRDNTIAELNPDDNTDHVGNRDDDGDELYHDVVDVLFSVQPERWASHGLVGKVPRDEWRGLAKRLHNTTVCLHQLSIPVDSFGVLVRILLPSQWNLESHSASQSAGAETRSAAECILRAFGQEPEGITWPAFNDALKNAAPNLLNPMLRNLCEILLGEVGAGTDLCELIELDSMEAPSPGKIASPALLNQLGTLFSAQRIFEFRCTKHWAGADKPSAATLFADLAQSMQEQRSVILLIAGEDVAGGGKCIFDASKGVVSPWLQSMFDQGRSVGPFLMPIPAKLFQLYPVQDVFPEGDFGLVDSSLRFEGPSSPAFVNLEPELDGGSFNAGREAAGSKALGLSTSRKRGLVQFKVQELELWEQFDLKEDE